MQLAIINQHQQISFLHHDPNIDINPNETALKRLSHDSDPHIFLLKRGVLIFFGETDNPNRYKSFANNVAKSLRHFGVSKGDGASHWFLLSDKNGNNSGINGK